MKNFFNKIFTIVTLLLVDIAASAQSDSALVEVPYLQNSRKTFAKYYITLPDSLKNGKYTRYTMWQEIASEGQYKNDIKVGIWKYYDDSHKLFKALDHSTTTVIYIDSTLYNYANADYFGDEIDKSTYINKRIKELFSKEELKALKGKEYKVHFKIDNRGKAIEVDTKFMRGDIPKLQVEEKLIKIIEEMPNWIIVNRNKNISNSFVQPINFK